MHSNKTLCLIEIFWLVKDFVPNRNYRARYCTSLVRVHLIQQILCSNCL